MRNISAHLGTYYDGASISVDSYVGNGYQDSVNHRKSPDGKYHEGGDWYMVKSETQRVFGKTAVGRGPNGEPYYNGGFYIQNHADLQNIPQDVPNFTSELQWKLRDLADLRNRGAEAFGAMRPDEPDFSLANTLMEIKDVPQMLKQGLELLLSRMRRQSGRTSWSHAGEWFLAIEFGWLPLLNDIQTFTKAHNAKQKRLTQLIRDEGKPVKRRRKLRDDDRVFIKESGHHGSPYYVGALPFLTIYQYGDGEASYETTYDRDANTWCVGQFRYVLPPGPRDVAWKKKMLRYIMGFRPTPSVIYNMIPWSWLVDYFSDLKHFVAAVSPGVSDNCVMDYGYLMRTRSWSRTTSVTQNVRAPDGNSVAISTALIDSTHVKMRVKADPFGFSPIPPLDLTPKQLAILAAIPLSRS